MTDRRFNEEEAAVILRRAVEAADEDSGDGGPDGKGLTLAELREIGAEAGIEAGRIEEAAASLVRSQERSVRRNEPAAASALGLATTVQLERVVPAKLDEERLPELFDIIRGEFARQGIVEEVLGGFEWRARSGMGGRYVSIRAEGDQTRIQVLGNYRDGGMALAFGVGPICAASAGALVVAMGMTGLAVILPAALAGGVAAALTPWKMLFRREERSLHRVIEALERSLAK